MRLTSLVLGFLLLAPDLIAQGERKFDAAASDPRAVEISQKLMAALGGREAWDGLHFLRFDFVSEREGKQTVIRSHWWDKYTGRHRVEGKTKEGEPWVVLHNVNTREGSAYRNGVKLEGDDAKALLENAYGAWVNDTYWLLMPYKLNDPGVNLAYDGEETIDGVLYDKVIVTFDNVGLTPKDKYWAYVNRSTGLMDRWAYILKGGPGPATPWLWKGWRKYGEVMLAPERVNVESGNKLILGSLEVPGGMPDAIFDSRVRPQETRVSARAVSRDAKVIYDAVGGARITVRELTTGRLLASGIQHGNSGDTDRIMKQPRHRGASVYDTQGVAGYTATLYIDQPTMVEIRAEGPLGNPEATQVSSKTMWLVPGQDIGGDGVVLEIHGFIVDLVPPTVAGTSALPVKATVRMACGCPTESGGLWDADRIRVMARLVRADGTIAAEAPMRYAGERNTFAGEIVAPPAGQFNLQVIAMQPESANFGLGSRQVNIGS